MMRYPASVFLLVLFVATGSITPQAIAATDCSTIPGTRVATENDAVVKNGQVKAGSCYNPNEYGISQSTEEAKAYLNTLPKRPLSNCAPPNQQNINRLNDAFAVCTARFFQAYQKQYGDTVTITSAFRDDTRGSGPDGRKSANQCAGGVPGSNHSKGVAMDVYPNSGNWQRIWTFASNNPQFGVCFPFQNTPIPGYPNGDRPHMILAGIGGSEGSRCAAQGVTKACDGVKFDPNQVRPGSNTPPSASPTAGFTNAIRQALTPLMAAPAQPAPAAPSQPLPTTQSPTSAFTLPTPEILPTVVVASSSIADRLEDLAFGTTTTTSSATSVPLVIDTRDVGGIQSSLNSSQQPGTTVTGGSVTQNTFVTQDLNWSNSTASQSSFQRTLSTLQSILVQLLQYMQPFRSRTTGEVLE